MHPSSGIRFIITVSIAMLFTAPMSGAACASENRAVTGQDAKAGVESAAREVSIVDAAGRSLKLKDRPSRIVIAGIGPFMTLDLLGMFPYTAGKVVGYEERSRSTEFMERVDGRYRGMNKFKPNPGVEQVAALKPDLVIMKSGSTNVLGSSLERLRIPVMYVGLETPEQFLLDLGNIGIVLGQQARAARISAYYRGQLENMRKQVAAIPEASKPRVLFISYHNRGGKAAVEVPAPSWMQTIQVREAGGFPVWTGPLKKTDNWSVVNFEQIAGWNPDIIFVSCWYTLDPAKVIAGFRADQRWARLKAVKSGKLYAMPSDIFGWDSPEPRWILGMAWMAATIWPDLFPEYSLTGSVRGFFRELYAMDDTAIDTLIMPELKHVK